MNTAPTGLLLLIPAGLGDVPWTDFLPEAVQSRATRLHHFIVENARTARANLKRMGFPGTLRDTDILELPAEGSDDVLDALLAPAMEGKDIGLMSDAGCPAVADPGARLVARAHALSVRVVPLVGPSSILLGLMGSGLNGQNFTFHGYLPSEMAARDQRLRTIEDESRQLGRTQIFIETPYRNEHLFAALLRICRPATRLCVACGLTTTDEYLRTQTVADWRKTPVPMLAKRPTLFLLLA